MRAKEFSKKPNSNLVENDTNDDKKLKGFHQSLGNAVRGRMSQMQADMAILKARKPDTWLWEPGDLVYSARTGRTYKIVGHWLDNRGVPKYFYQGNDEERGTLIADRAHQTLTKISGQSDIQENVIDESLNQPYKLIDWDEDIYEDEVSTWAALPDGTYLEIKFDRSDSDDWQVEFKRDDSMQKTGQGDAQRIFATVLLAIKQFIKKYDPDEISFSSLKHQDETGSRESLYNALVKKYAAGLGYSLNVTDDSYHRHYLFNRIQQGVAEKKLLK